MLLCLLFTAAAVFPEKPGQVNAMVNKTFIIKLISNPTTGYGWQLQEPLDKQMLKLVRSDFQRPRSNLVGAPGKEIWTFKALKPGKTTIRMKYVRPWEKGLPPVETRTYDVNIISML